MQIVQKIPVFDGLSLDQAQLLIQVSKFSKYEAGKTIYDIGGASDEMLILVKGKLNVLSDAGQLLGEVPPGSSIGEMGVFTGHPRSATIITAEECVGLEIRKNQLLGVMNADQSMKSIILENVVGMLSSRLADANSKLDVLTAQQQQAAHDLAQLLPESPEPDSSEAEAVEESQDEAEVDADTTPELNDDDTPEAEDPA